MILIIIFNLKTKSMENVKKENKNFLDVVKVNSVYILTEEQYSYLFKCYGLLKDIIGTNEQFKKAYENIN